MWTPIATNPGPSARLGVAWAWSGAELYVFGGRPAGSGASGEGFAYDPQMDKWRNLPPVNAPAPRYDAFATWQDGTFLVVGGRDANGVPLADGASYDPSTDAWAAIPPLVAVSPRSAPARQTGWAAWTGVRSILAGGLDASGALQIDGAQYEPNASSWTGAVVSWPSAKQHEWGVGLWTGHELMVWSGLSDGVLVTAGERYLP
jgi:hypothetical protein